VCVCEREGERDRDRKRKNRASKRKKERERKKWRGKGSSTFVSLNSRLESNKEEEERESEIGPAADDHDRAAREIQVRVEHARLLRWAFSHERGISVPPEQRGERFRRSGHLGRWM